VSGLNSRVFLAKKQKDLLAFLYCGNVRCVLTLHWPLSMSSVNSCWHVRSCDVRTVFVGRNECINGQYDTADGSAQLVNSSLYGTFCETFC
jgi:hypothetical protein